SKQAVMFNLEKNKKVLEQNGNKYTLEETKIITEFLALLIEVQGANLKKYLQDDDESSIDGSSIE
ncbi:MAG: hypothetical protein EBZ58_12185, partial [Bacteroidetes bacterium]|nr:hypothetical protein [Bacteroidota bacterium]